MKKQLLLPACMLVLNGLFAQDSRMVPPQRNYMVTFSPAALYTGKIAVGTEINSGRRSIHVMAGIPFMHNFTYQLDGADRSIDTKTFSMYGGYRFYFGKKEGRGFYIEPYAKCLDNHAWTEATFTLIKTESNFAIKSDYDAKGLGAQLGVQFQIAHRVVIDWYFAGPEINFSEFEIAARQLGESGTWDEAAMSDAQSEISHLLKDIPYFGDKTSFSADPNKRIISATYKGIAPGLRTGISIGIKF